MRALEVFNMLSERHNVYKRRALGESKPWTNDVIIRSYRFTNAYRELDTVTQWISNNWRTPNQQDPELWFAMAVARFVNWPDTLTELGYPVPWKPKHFVKVLHDRKDRGEKVFTGAYMISAGGVVNGMSKAEYVANSVLTPLWQARKALKTTPTGLLADWHAKACEYPGMGSFMAAQVVADYKYAEMYRNAPDWWTFAASGPGSRRGLNRLLSRTLHAPWKESVWRANMKLYQIALNTLWEPFDGQQLHMQDVQGSLCEFDKYERVRLGEGRPRSLYPGV